MAREQLEMDEADEENPLVIENEDLLKPHSRLVPALVLLAAIGGFVGLAWYAYTAGTRSMGDEELLVVEADKTPIKEKPLNPGGMQFPNQDKTIFQAISSNPKPPPPDHVQPPPEAPLSRPEIVAAAPAPQTQAKPAAPATENNAAPVSPPVATQPAPAPEARKAPPPAPPVALKAETPAPKPKATAPREAPKPETPKPAKTLAAKPGGAVIQLGAYRSEAEANAAWHSLEKKFKSLSGLSPHIVKADLGAKGIYYRLRANVANAGSTCASLSARGQACIKVK